MEVKAVKVFDEDFDYCKNINRRTSFAEQVFIEHLLVKHLSMTAYIKLSETRNSFKK